MAAFDDVENIQISRVDFMHALDEVQAAFGVSEEELQQVVQNGIIHYSQRINVSLLNYTLADDRISSTMVVSWWSKSGTPLEHPWSAPFSMAHLVRAKQL